MINIDWNKLGQRGKSKQDSFENLCLYLFCRRLAITKIDAYYNQPGIETEPVEVQKKKYGFQAKYFDSKFDWDQIKNSIKKAIQLYPELDVIYVYSNRDRTRGNQKDGKTKVEFDLENLAKKKNITIEYITNQGVFLLLSQPSNIDLSQFYFDTEDKHTFIKNSINSKTLTFIQSSEYLELPFVNKKNGKNEKVQDKILKKDASVFLLLGHPGSGKSIFMHKLLEIFGGLNQKTEANMMQVLVSNNAVPILINLKNCALDSLENILRMRKDDCNINNRTLGFIYLFDGLDELDGEHVEIILSQIYELSQSSNTKKIIISCRTGSANRIKAYSYFAKISEYQIADLGNRFMSKFFTVKGNKSKQQKLIEYKANNERLIKEIKDILLIKLLWETIGKLDDTSTILDLFQKKIELLLEDPKHKKNIEDLNLLNSKKQAIIELNQDIAFELQKTYQFRFSHKDLQKLILKKFDRIDYKSVNDIISYISNLFFEKSNSDALSDHEKFIYQHRRYQEFFLTQKLKTEYEKDPQIIRKLGVISNREYFEKLFLKYLRKDYEQSNNLPGLVELNLIDVYLGKHQGFGVDDDYYMRSDEFIPALARQSSEVFNVLFEDGNLQLKDKVLIDFTEVNRQFDIFEKGSDQYKSKGYLRSIWEIGTSKLIENAVLFWKNGKETEAKVFILQLEKLTELYEEKKFEEKLSENEPLDNPYWNQFENWIYFRLIIKKHNVHDVFENLIRYNYGNFDEEYRHTEEAGKEELVKPFFRVCLDEKMTELTSLIDEFSNYEFSAFIETLSLPKYLPFYFKSKSLQRKVKKFISDFSTPISDRNAVILFFKKLIGIKLDDKELTYAESELDRLRNTRTFEWRLYNTQHQYALMSFVLTKNSFEKYLQKQEGHQFRYFNELGLYSALFVDYIQLLMNKKDIKEIIRDYNAYIQFYIEGKSYGQFLKVDISFLLAYIFSICELSNQSISKLKKLIFKEENDLIPFSFYIKVIELDSSSINRFITEPELKTFEDDLSNWKDDYPSLVDRCFHLSSIYASINTEKAKFYFNKGIYEGILRHGWRKDYIVSYLLVDALEIIWRNNWDTSENLQILSKEVFKLSIKVSEMTDGKGTWRAPYNLIETVANYDIHFAEKLKKKLIKSKGEGVQNNILVTIILLNKVKEGISVDKIEEEMNSYRQEYNGNGELRADYFEQKFIVYLEISENGLYTKKQQLYAFEKAYSQVKEIQKKNINYSFIDNEFKSKKIKYNKLCVKYKKETNLKIDKNDDITKKVIISEKTFIDEVKKSTSESEINGLYKKLSNYEHGIVLKKYESWKILIEKTFMINNNIELFTSYMLRNNFPHLVNYSNNSDFIHFGLAVALKSINTKEEAQNYLSKNSGHGGFVNVMRAYEAMGDEKMCLLLFNRFLKFCDLIVN